MSMEHIETSRLRAQAKYQGKSTFQHSHPCSHCKTHLCYTNQKGRACVECRRRYKESQRKDELKNEAIKITRRESYNRNRPSHNPEQILFNGVRRAKQLNSGVHNEAEYQNLSMKAQLLKLVNGGYPAFTLDHSIVPAGGVSWKGREIVGRTVAENLQLMTIEKNKAKSNSFDENKDIPLNVYAERTVDTFDIDQSTSTEELRKLFKQVFGVSTKQSSTFNREKSEDGEKVEYEKKPALREIDALRKAVVLEVWMAGYREHLEPSEKNPLPKVWDDETGKMVQPVIRVQKGLHHPAVVENAINALRWLDRALYQSSMALRFQDRGEQTPVNRIATEAGIIERIEQHFIEWVSSGYLNHKDSKPLFDFVGLVDGAKWSRWFMDWMDRENIKVLGVDYKTRKKAPTPNAFHKSSDAGVKPEPEKSFWDDWLDSPKEAA